MKVDILMEGADQVSLEGEIESYGYGNKALELDILVDGNVGGVEIAWEELREVFKNPLVQMHLEAD